MSEAKRKALETLSEVRRIYEESESDLLYKILRYLRQEEKNEGKINDQGLLNIRDQILSWSELV